jgi:myb proto-oncogene protein
VEEDAKLTEAVTEFGNDWVRVAVLFPGRTNRQCQTKWLTCLDHIARMNACSKGKWTAEEDAKLTEAVKEHGNLWVVVAALVPGRTQKQCRNRWVESLDPDINRGTCTVAEDAKLTIAVTDFGTEWAKVAVLVPGRTNAQCRKKWVKQLDPDRSKNLAEEEHDASGDDGRDDWI